MSVTLERERGGNWLSLHNLADWRLADDRQAGQQFHYDIDQCRWCLSGIWCGTDCWCEWLNDKYKTVHRCQLRWQHECIITSHARYWETNNACTYSTRWHHYYDSCDTRLQGLTTITVFKTVTNYNTSRRSSRMQTAPYARITTNRYINKNKYTLTYARVFWQEDSHTA